MSTRAVYTFKDSQDEYHVYKHHDGYPSGAAVAITNALKYAWQLPRFEACEFGAAFIAGNKAEGGGVYLTHHYKDHGDLEYRYEITCIDKELNVTAFELIDGVLDETWHEIFTGTLHEFIRFANHEKE